MLAFLQNLTFCCLLKFVYILSIHSAFPVFIILHAQNIGIQKFCLEVLKTAFILVSWKGQENLSPGVNKTFLLKIYICYTERNASQT